MSEHSMFDSTWARQDQWGGEWHGLGGRFGVAQQFMGHELKSFHNAPVEDTALYEWLAWIIDRSMAWVKQNQPEKETELQAFISEIRDIHKRPIDPALLTQLDQWMQRAGIDQQAQDRFRNTKALFKHMQETNFDSVQLQHLNGLFRAQGKLALAFHSLFGNGQLSRLEKDPKAPLIQVNAELMNRCATDFRLAQQAVHQRQRMPYENGKQWITWEAHMLYLADLMAYDCLKPLKAAGILPEETAVVTYLQQSTEIRLLPYYDIMLIALPSWIQNLYEQPSSAFLVIPHEVGHFLYRFGTFQRGGVKTKVYEALNQGMAALDIQNDDWRARWLEELFADAFGCLMAGPASILGIQEYLATGIPEHFLDPTPDHPIAAIRPLIQTEMLRILDERCVKSYKSVPTLLDQHWQIFLENNGSPKLCTGDVKSVDFPLPYPTATLSGEAVLDGLRPVLSLIFDIFDELFPGDASPKHWETWSCDITADGGPVFQNLDVLLTQYREYYQRPSVLTIAPPAAGEKAPAAGEKAPADDDGYQPSPLHYKIRAIANKLARDQPDVTIPLEEWRQIIDIAGWTDEGGKASHNP